MPARAATENSLTQAVHSLFAVAEAYPVLKSNENMRTLQEELASTENKLAFARQHYNDSVMEYNTARETFPRNLLASSFGFAPETMFTLEDHVERSAPKVQF